jgi:diguanylate cyclase (GGDEF)-like protein/PAS domain S-box-containing protein
MKVYRFLQNNPTFSLIFVIVSVCLCVILFSVFLYFKLENDKKLTNSAIELNRITNSIRAGLVHFSLNDTCSILYASKGFFELLGYTKKEAREENKFSIIDFVHSKDRDSFWLRIQDIEEDAFSFEVRLLKKDGNVIYVLISGNCVTSKDGNQSVSAVFVDITEQKRMQEMLRMDRERYRIASEISHDVLFEYYVDIDKMVFTDKYLELYGRYPVIANYVKECYGRKDYVHPDDYGIYLEFCRILSSGSELVDAEFRFKDRHNNYIWCQLIGKTMYNEENKPIRVIGKMVNIDYQKRELDSLEYKATRDPLTGVYNREVTIKKIEKYINGNKNGKHVLMFIDFDDFKKVNDNHGHLLGDKVLTHVIKSIKGVFTEGEIIGRIGGDEFVVFMGNIEDDEAALHKAKALIEALSTAYVDGYCHISISGSVGIASYPQDGLHYEQLIQCADRALYYVKNRGKNNYMFYNPAI